MAVDGHDRQREGVVRWPNETHRESTSTSWPRPSSASSSQPGSFGLEWQPASDMAGLLQQLQQELVGERWEEAAATLQEVHAQWEKRRKWLVLNNSRNAVFRFEEQLARVTPASAFVIGPQR